MNTLYRNVMPSLLALCCALLFLSSTTVTAKQKSKYNVLFIAADDLRPELGAYGNLLIKTPNIDRLASWGLRFDRAYAQYPLCNPSRTSLLTGRHPTTTGVLDNETWFRAAHPYFISLPQHFKANGYATLRSGKIFHGGLDDSDAWNEGGEPRNFTGARRNPSGQDSMSRSEHSDRIVVLDGDGESNGDYKTATRAIEYLGKYRDKQFFLAVGFSKPHSPLAAPQKFFDLYDPASIELPPDFAASPSAPAGFPEISIPRRNTDLFIGRDATPDEARKMIRAYYASVSFMDAQVGRVLNELERLKLLDKTVIVFFGDHGYHLGEKGKWSKAYSLYEVATRVPLILVRPKVRSRTSSGRTAQLLDLFPTLTELCGLERPKGLEGHSLVPLLHNPNASWNYPAFSVTRYKDKLGKSVRTERWHYAEWEEGKSGSMLFDHSRDPRELKNLADNPVYAKTVKKMKKLLQQIPANTKLNSAETLTDH